MNPILADIVRRVGADVAERKKAVPVAWLEKSAARAPSTRSLSQALRGGGGIGVIAELKQKSPSAGILRNPYDVADGARAYDRAGVRAISVLTEPHYFGGRPEHLTEARNACGRPILRKDFIVDPYQIAEARAWGADAVLLIVRILDGLLLSELLAETRQWALEALVEVHAEGEIDRALKAGADLLGINSRNLDTLSLDSGAFARMAPLIPAGKTVVAESGLKTGDDIRRLKPLGVHGVLVGESILRQERLEDAARQLVEAGA